MLRLIPALLLASLAQLNVAQADWPPADAKPLTWEGDIASRMIDGCDRFLLRQYEPTAKTRASRWKLYTGNFYLPGSVSHKRSPKLGMRLDERPAPIVMEGNAPLLESPVAAEADGFKIIRVRWRAFGNVDGEGLLALPADPPKANIVAIPDADVSPEALFGLVEGVPAESQFARKLAEQGCRVLVPTLIDRSRSRRNGRANLTNREYLYRPAFVLGRHLIGYELHKVLAGVEWFRQQDGIFDAELKAEYDARPEDTNVKSHQFVPPPNKTPVGVIGWGEGGMLALFAGAIDTRIDAVCVSGFFSRHERIWEEPISRNVFGRLVEHGDAELAGLVHPRTVIVEACRGPELTLTGEGGAPAVLRTPSLESTRHEWKRFQDWIAPTKLPANHELIVSGDGRGAYGSTAALKAFMTKGLNVEFDAERTAGEIKLVRELDHAAFINERMQRQVRQIVAHNRQALHESEIEQDEFMQMIIKWHDEHDLSSEELKERKADLRDQFHRFTIGRFDLPLQPANPRIRKTYDEEKWTGYEVVLDVYPDVFAYGILCVPKDIKPDEKRPVVVCQHGLEGRPQDVVTGDHRAYHDFAAKLAERGFVTFAPQNIYIFGDRFRTLQRKANPLGKTLFSIMVPQHRQITGWLRTLPFVDGERIGFYGLSYGGKSAMRIPPLVDNYCLSICSADFNDWVWKNASTDSKYSYVWTGEYEIFEFGLGRGFNYAQMAALIAPRPFMVERGHFDGVAPDDRVASEFAKVRRLYAAKLGLPDRCEIEWFVGPHTINGKGTFEFLHRHLDWPE